MSQDEGYLYVRDHESYDGYNVYKVGTTRNIPDRDSTYTTGEYKRGNFIIVLLISLQDMETIEKLIENKFYKLHHTNDDNLNHINDGGTEFYSREILNDLESYLDDIGVIYTKLSNIEICELTRCIRKRDTKDVNNEINRVDIEKSLIRQLTHKKETIYKPRTINPYKHQQDVLDMIEGFYNARTIGKIVWACGLGKALLSVLIVDLLKFSSVLFGVPSNTLQKQIKAEILKLFPNKDNILCIGGDDNYGIKSTTYSNKVSRFLNSNFNSQPKFVISTYHSCHLLVNMDCMFDFKIGDEAHHLVGVEKEETRGFRLFHKINSSKTLYMTATEKTIETRTDKIVYSMDDVSIFGEYIDVKSVHWAIENKKITDYNILVLKNTQDDVDTIINILKLNITNKELFISCYMCLKSFEKYTDLTHVLLYANTTEDAELCKSYIDELLKLNIVAISKNDIYNNALHSKLTDNLDGEVDTFKNMPYGIISCVYIFGEGFDLPQLNGVCIAGNMQSETRIVQYLLRPNRLDVEKPDKKAYVIIPYIDDDDWETDNKSYEKVRTIVSHMRNVDENIEQKLVISVGKRETNEMLIRAGNVIYYEGYDLQENCDELNRLKLRLRYSKTLGSKFTEERDEYNYVRSLNASLNIKSKKEYSDIKDSHIHFITSPDEYFKLKGVWNNWYDFMGVDTTKFIQSKQDWFNFCKEKCIKSLNGYYRACEENEQLPKEPADFYADFTNIPNELGFNRNRRR